MSIYAESDYFFDKYQPVTKKDERAILNAMDDEIEIRVDEVGRVWTEGDIYVADVVRK